VAFCTLGSGPPLVVVPSGPWTTIAVQWGVPDWRRWNELLAEHHRVIVYDPCGAGLSDPPADGRAFSVQAQLLELQTVVDRLGLDRFALFGAQHAGPVAITYAVERPERVSHVVLWCSYSSATDYFGEPRSRVVHEVLDKDWELFTETIAHAQLGWSEVESASRLAALLREHLTPAMVASFDEAARARDVASTLPMMTAPALVLHRRQLRHPDLAISRRLAAGLADSRLVVLEGESIAPFVGDVEAGLEAIEDFLLPGVDTQARQPRTNLQPGLADPLSERELEVLRLLAAGLSNAEVAHELVIAAGTVKTHTASIYSKLEVNNRTRAVARARELGLLD
jgi:DNA-binding CsgD family transcriptional regulator/pimeloyl-ACP methyl ester carboxylesterase